MNQGEPGGTGGNKTDQIDHRTQAHAKSDHKAISHSGHVIEPGSVIMYDGVPGTPLVGEVEAVFELEGCFVLQHRVYDSGLVSFDKWGVHQQAVVLSSLSMHLAMVELNTNHLACITCVHVGGLGVLIM